MQVAMDQAKLAESARRTGHDTLNLVGQMAQAIKVAEDLGQARADRGQELAQLAVDELKVAEARIKSLEELLLQAEAHAKDSEGMLERVHTEIERILANQPRRPPFSIVPLKVS